MRPIISRLPVINKTSLKNIGWLLGDHLITFVGGFFISIWLARYLSPGPYGIYSYALALFAIAANFSQLGLNAISIKELVSSKDVDLSISTIGMLKAVGAMIAYSMLCFYAYHDADSESKLLISIIIGAAVLLKPFTVLDNYFDSRVTSKYKVIARKAGYITKMCLLVCFILLEWPLWILGLVVVIEQLLPTTILTYFYLRDRKRFHFNTSKKLASDLLDQSWPLIISGLGGTLYLTMDQVMVVSMIGDVEGGIYAAAVRYTSIFFFLQSILITTFYPALIKSKGIDEHKYQSSVVRLSSTLLYLSIAVLLGTYLFIKPFIMLTYGTEYLGSIPIIKLHIWSLPLVFLGAVLSKWLVIENLTKFSLLRHSMGLMANLGLNLWLIPLMGPQGAAIASIIALVFSVLVVLVFHRRLRILSGLFMQSVIFPFTLLRSI